MRVRAMAIAALVSAIVGGVWAARALTAEDPPEWVSITDQQAAEQAADHDNALIDQDQLKPQARGEFGPFLLVGPKEAGESPRREHCESVATYGLDNQAARLSPNDIKSSPLAIPEISATTSVASACGDVVAMVSGAWLMRNEWGGEESADILIYLIGYLPAHVEWDTAAERTELAKIDGYPALIEKPISGLIMDFPREAYVLFAEPKDGKPGIVFRVGATSPERVAETVIASLENRIAEMGLPPNPYD